MDISLRFQLLASSFAYFDTPLHYIFKYMSSCSGILLGNRFQFGIIQRTIQISVTFQLCPRPGFESGVVVAKARINQWRHSNGIWGHRVICFTIWFNELYPPFIIPCNLSYFCYRRRVPVYCLSNLSWYRSSKFSHSALYPSVRA